MNEIRLATPQEVRAAVDRVHEDIRIPHTSEKFPNGEIVVRWETILTTDRLALLGGFRVSEVVTKHSKNEGNTSDTMSLEVTEHKATGEEALIIRVNALKKKNQVQREIGIPLKAKHEPWAKPVLEAWEKQERNPCKISRQEAWAANRVVFAGLGYKVKSWIRYERDEAGKILRDEKRKKMISEIIPTHLNQGSDHILRHIRVEELRKMQVTREERTAFFSWSTMNLEGAAVMDDYSQPEWFEYFPKLLKKEKRNVTIKA